MNDGTRKPSRAVRIVAYLMVAVFCVVLLEIGAGIANKFTSKRYGRVNLDQTAVRPSPWLPHRLNETYGEGTSPENEKYYHTHSTQGFKYPREIAVPKPPRTVRIFAMGGSTLYGWGSEGLANYGNHKPLTNQETITYFLEKRLNEELHKTHPDWNVEVVNAAVIDYNSAFHLVYYNQVIWPYHPDAVLFLDGNNEFFGMQHVNSFTDYKNTGVNIIDNFNDRSKYFTRYVIMRNLAQYSKLFMRLQYRVMNQWLEKEAPTVNPIYVLPDSFDDFDAKYDARARLFQRNYAQIKAAADFDRVGMMVFLGPELLLEYPEQLSAADIKTREQVIKDGTTPQDKVRRDEFMRRVRARLPRYFQEINVPYHDETAYLGSAANKEKAMFIDYTHVTPVGAEVVADKMLEPVFKQVLEIIESSPEKRAFHGV